MWNLSQLAKAITLKHSMSCQARTHIDMQALQTSVFVPHRAARHSGKRLRECLARCTASSSTSCSCRYTVSRCACMACGSSLLVVGLKLVHAADPALLLEADPDYIWHSGPGMHAATAPCTSSAAEGWHQVSNALHATELLQPVGPAYSGANTAELGLLEAATTNTMQEACWLHCMQVIAHQARPGSPCAHMVKFVGEQALGPGTECPPYHAVHAFTVSLAWLWGSQLDVLLGWL